MTDEAKKSLIFYKDYGIIKDLTEEEMMTAVLVIIVIFTLMTTSKYKSQ